jgi:uncharacterized protein (DUF1684 family)
MNGIARRSTRVVLGGCAAIAVVASCSTKPSAPAAGAVIEDEAAWRAQLLQARAAKDHDMKTAPTSMFAAVERFAPTETAHLAIEDDVPRLDAQRGPGTLVTFQPTDPTHWTWQPTDPGVTATTGDGKRVLTPGPIAEQVLIRLSPRFHVSAQIAGGGFVLTVYDAQRPELLEFDKLSYFPPDPRFVVAAKVERFATPTPIRLTTNRGLQKPFVRYAKLTFELGGQPYSLVAFRPEGSTSRHLFIPFRDATSGKTTYGAARFLDVEEPADRAAPLRLDFNEAYSPYCAYSPAYNCPLPPVENQLAGEISAGERHDTH